MDMGRDGAGSAASGTPDAGTAAPLSQILGRPTERSVTLVVISVAGVEAHVE